MGGWFGVTGLGTLRRALDGIEHGVLYATDESQDYTPETKNIVYVN